MRQNIVFSKTRPGMLAIMAHTQIKNQHELTARVLKQDLISSQAIFNDIVNFGGIYLFMHLFILEGGQNSLAQPNCRHRGINFSIVLTRNIDM